MPRPELTTVPSNCVWTPVNNTYCILHAHMLTQATRRLLDLLSPQDLRRSIWSRTPEDIVYLIVMQAASAGPPAVRVTMSRLSKAFHNAIDPMLYRNVLLTSERASEAFAQTLKTKDEKSLQQHVRTLTLQHMPNVPAALLSQKCNGVRTLHTSNLASDYLPGIQIPAAQLVLAGMHFNVHYPPSTPMFATLTHLAFSMDAPDYWKFPLTPDVFRNLTHFACGLWMPASYSLEARVSDAIDRAIEFTRIEIIVVYVYGDGRPLEKPEILERLWPGRASYPDPRVILGVANPYGRWQSESSKRVVYDEKRVKMKFESARKLRPVLALTAQALKLKLQLQASPLIARHNSRDEFRKKAHHGGHIRSVGICEARIAGGRQAEHEDDGRCQACDKNEFSRAARPKNGDDRSTCAPPADREKCVRQVKT
ncbi:hypothetical protein FISHEDRAFT_60001 [Fistulina hepatica ATCC 64428]|uniref:Uncharacterized protein n=1 Tax=Fistulina hepatica ATCC 64428 TaxID=1128425 RepID=A0A0D7A7Z9_9AGAR|nr:hypothetical protein FISHEDRAFT_60001 [Fistulina hepatica ATCC 64428]